MTPPGKDHISDILKGKGNIIDFKFVPGVSGDGIPVRCRHPDSPGGLWEQRVGAGLAKDRGRLFLRSLGTGRKKPRDMGPDGLWTHSALCFFLVRVLFGYFTPWNFVFRPPKKSLRIPQHMLLMMIFSYRIVQTWCFWWVWSSGPIFFCPKANSWIRPRLHVPSTKSSVEWGKPDGNDWALL